MAAIEGIPQIVMRQATSIILSATAVATDAPSTDIPRPNCPAQNGYDGRMGIRVSAIFVILIGSLLGAVFPVYAHNHKGVKVPEWAFFVAKYFGSGVIISTAFIHLLAPANNALNNPCLTGIITQYSWVEGIVLMTIFALFFTELMAMRFSTFGHTHEQEDPEGHHDLPNRSASTQDQGHGHTPGDDHLGHSREHHDAENNEDKPGEDYAAQMTAIFILEFGVIFHSIFIGLTLAVAGEEFNTLYVVLVFHQTFEGLGLGSRLAVTPWPKTKQWTPYALGLAYALSTPIAISVGLGLRQVYVPGSQTALTINGVFDSISAGILIYTGLVELMAHEIMFSEVMRKARLSVVLSAFLVMCLGAGLMALLGKWA